MNKKEHSILFIGVWRQIMFMLVHLHWFRSPLIVYIHCYFVSY